MANRETIALVQQLHDVLMLTRCDAEKNGFEYGCQSNCAKALKAAAIWLEYARRDREPIRKEPNP